MRILQGLYLTLFFCFIVSTISQPYQPHQPECFTGEYVVVYTPTNPLHDLAPPNRAGCVQAINQIRIDHENSPIMWPHSFRGIGCVIWIMPVGSYDQWPSRTERSYIFWDHIRSEANRVLATCFWEGSPHTFGQILLKGFYGGHGIVANMRLEIMGVRRVDPASQRTTSSIAAASSPAHPDMASFSWEELGL
jgi:hypothetical protein